MMNETAADLRAVMGLESCKCMLLLRVFRQGARLRPLVFAIIGIVLTTLGWKAIGWVFSGSEQTAAVQQLYSPWPWHSVDSVPDSVLRDGEVSRWTASWYASRPWQQLVGFGVIFKAQTPVVVTAYLILCLLWAVAVWSLAGGALTRVAAVGLTRGEQISGREAGEFALSKWLSYLGGPGLPLAGMIVLAILMGIGGLFMRIPGIGMFLVGMGWPLWLIAGLLVAVLLIGLAASWPLMWGAISVEGTDAFDSLGRSYGYLFGKPLHYLGYAIVAWILGSLGVWVITLFTDTVLSASAWGVSWGSGAEQLALIAHPPEDMGTINHWGASLFAFWNGLVRLVPIAFAYSFFWTAAVAIYLLLRWHEDQTELHEVYFAEPERVHGLPALTPDAAGVPQVDDGNGNGNGA